MIERAIENWLINTNERNYQTPFCQALMVQGHTILYNSRHGPLEEGKDIVTVDKEGKFHAYQLKTGNIDLRVWRDIQGEIDDLVRVPIVHPSVPRGSEYQSYLVCNGEINDIVRSRIIRMNEYNLQEQRAYSYLSVIQSGQLLEFFVKAQKGFLPGNLEGFEAFRNLQLSDGADFIDKDALFRFLTEYVLSTDIRGKSNRINAVSSSVVLMSHLLKPHQDKENHFALFEAWGLLAASIVNFAISQNLKTGWQDSFELAFEEAIDNLQRLATEALNREDFLEGDLFGDGGWMYRGRLTIILGSVALLELHRINEKKATIPDTRIVEMVVGNYDNIWIWGESAIPFVLNIVWLFESAGLDAEAERVLGTTLDSILQSNSKQNTEICPLAPPYCSLSWVLETVYGFSDKPTDLVSSPGNSYTLDIVVQTIARRELRHLLAPNWREATHIHQQQFVPDRAEDYFSWHLDRGKNVSYFLQQKQSWSSLVEHSTQSKNDVLLRFKKLLHVFTLIAPHRLNTRTTAVIDPYVNARGAHPDA